MRYPPVVQKTVLVTGCSTGIGRATAEYLRERGWRVFPTARKAADLDTLRARGFEAIELDVAREDSVATAVEQVLKLSGGTLGALVNNAGYGQPGAIEDVPRAAWRQQFEVNVFGLVDLTRRLIPVFRRQGYGRIVNVGSVVGRITLPFMGAYCASKFAVASISSALRMELRGTGIAVSLIEPGPIETAFRTHAVEAGRQHVSAADSPHAQAYRRELEDAQGRAERRPGYYRPPRVVAEKIAHALESSRPRRRYPVTFEAHLGAFLARHAPEGWVEYLLSRRRG